MITPLDTHATVKDLVAAGFDDAQAEALTRVLRQAQEIDFSELVTKSDLHVLQRDLNETKGELQREISDVKSELQREISDAKSELRREMAELKADLIKWVVGMGFAQVAMILAVLRLLPPGHP
jgi:F0F1-type ATP synthase membrane subunit b/b'